MQESKVVKTNSGHEIHTLEIGTIDMQFLKTPIEESDINIACLIQSQLKDEYKDWRVWVESNGQYVKKVTISKVVTPS
jgi:hypothetical protein